MTKNDVEQYIFFTLIEFCYFILLLLSNQKFSVAFWFLTNSENFGLIIQKQW
jgi:hypothetical protein